MKKSFFGVVVSVFLIASMARAQEPGAGAQSPIKTLLFNVELFEFSPELDKEIEKLVQEKAGMDRLVKEGRIKPVADLLIRARSGEAASARVGQRIPIPKESSQVDYENTGLNIDISSAFLADDKIQVSFKLEFSAVGKNAATRHRTFLQRSFVNKVQVKPNERVALLSAVQRGSLWPDELTGDSGYGNFVVVLTARVLD